jgi:hypothetical protein
MLRSIAPIVAATVLAGCVTYSGAEPGEATGQIDLALVGQAENGSVFRLRDATLTVSGGFGALTFSTEDDPDRTAITQRLAPGSYELALGSTWRLERLAADGATVPVTAVLLSANPQSFAIEPDEVTQVALRFGVAGGAVQLGDGDLEIGVDVDLLPPPSVVLTVDLQVDEGGVLYAGIRLSQPPAEATVVTIESDNPAALVVAPQTVTFTPTTWAAPQLLTMLASTDDDFEPATVTITARIDATTATHAVVQVIDTTLVAVGWPEPRTDFTTIVSPTISLFQTTIDAPLEVRHLQVTAAGSEILLGLYTDAGGRPDARALVSSYGWADSLGRPTTIAVEEPAIVPPGTYWLAVANSFSVIRFANAVSDVTTARCRTPFQVDLPASLAGVALTCDQAQPIAIAALGRP